VRKPVLAANVQVKTFFCKELSFDGKELIEIYMFSMTLARSCGEIEGFGVVLLLEEEACIDPDRGIT
jgi:hypothetical protein